MASIKKSRGLGWFQINLRVWDQHHKFHQGQLSGSQSSSEPLRRRQMLGAPCWWEEPQGPTLVSFAGGLGVSQLNGVRSWPAYISSAPGFPLRVSKRRLFKAGGWEACGRPPGLVQGLRKPAEDDGPNADPPNKNRRRRQRTDSTKAWRRL